MLTFLMVVQLLVAIALTVAVVLQESKGEGMGSIGGSSKLFFNKASQKEIILEKATKYLAVAFLVLGVVISIL